MTRNRPRNRSRSLERAVELLLRELRPSFVFSRATGRIWPCEAYQSHRPILRATFVADIDRQFPTNPVCPLGRRWCQTLSRPTENRLRQQSTREIEMTLAELCCVFLSVWPALRGVQYSRLGIRPITSHGPSQSPPKSADPIGPVFVVRGSNPSTKTFSHIHCPPVDNHSLHRLFK